MDSTSGSYMQYDNHNDDAISQFLNGAQDYADMSNDSENQFDPALFADNGLASFSQQTQPSQSAQSNFNHGQHRRQSQSPVLLQFKPTPNTYSPQQYGQHIYNQQPLGQTFDPQMLSRPTPSPGPFDQFAYQPQHMNYGQHNFNYSYNSFQQQRQQSSTPSQAFRPQVTQQAHQYLDAARPSPIPQAHISQVQNHNGMSYPFQQGHQMHIEPSLLNAHGQLHPNMPQIAQSRQMESSPYFTKAGAGPTLDPRALQMQQHHLQMQRNQIPSTNAQQSGGTQPQPNMQSVLQFPQQNVTANRGAIGKAQAKKDGQSSGDAFDSDDSLDIEDEEPPEAKPAIITIAKPADEKRKLEWEVVDAVWTPKNRPAAPEKIRTAVKIIGEAIRGVRDKWKEFNEKLKKAENANQPTEELKLMVGDYRGLVERLAARITQFGHPSILKRLGENLILLSALYSFLLDRVNAEDYDSTLVATILQLGTKLETVDEEQLEKVKWTKILISRFAKRSTNESKTYAQQIVANAKKATARKKTEAAGQGPVSPPGSSTGQVAGVKRPREGGETIQQAKKAAVKPSSKPLSVQLAEQRKQKEKEKVAAAKDAKVTTTNGAAVAARPKPATAVPQKTSQFASLMSAKKKPGTSNAERAAKEKVEAVKAPTTMTTAPKKEPIARPEPPASKPAATSSSSFLGFLADMDKPKEAPKAKVEEDPDETPEARAKRLRKESRKMLHVSWKPESELAETRIFEHDPDEETGHEDSQMRDVGDTGKEGEMLKHRLQVDEDESESDSDDESSREYFAPSEVDFSTMKQAADDYENQNFIKYGGNLKPESPSSEAQAKHEDGTQMAMYAAGEQPDTPKEPPEAEDDDDFNPVIDFGEPLEERVRRREQRVLASRQPYQASSQPQSNGFDLASALSSMQPQQNQGQNQQDWLRALGLLAQPQPQQQAQGQAQPQQPQQQLDLSKILAVAQQFQQQPAAAAAAASAYQAPVSTSNSAHTAPVPDVSTLLGQLSGVAGLQQGYGAPAPLPTGSGDNPNPFPGKSEKKDTKKDKKRGKGGVPLNADGLPYNYKTKICQFWLDNSCTKGDACTYRHDLEGMDNS